MRELEQKARETALRRAFGASEAAQERLRAFNAGQTYTGRCRRCGWPWSGTLGSMPARCEKCGLGGGHGE